uniref:Uncharacterized protein n=1 Tax=Rhizophora mucronata TaxID=61149 RepID=A0A2P2L464_RHIMU
MKVSRRVQPQSELSYFPDVDMCSSINQILLQHFYPLR